ncbi:MAG: SDR family oxidoreductase [Bacteroidota bacterium]|jgi:dTDP-4-dehydrorhamnose reductase|nr:SDR family oxidoreductase [Bacteroidota bacterium]
MKKVLLTGANGLLGQKLVYALKKRPDINLLATAIGDNRLVDEMGYNYQSMDITDNKSTKETIELFSPDVIINCAAMTNVDACELNKVKCWDINVNGVDNLTKAAENIGAHFIHLSTDFVFDGKNGPYSENDSTNPLHYYAESKLASEKIVQKNCSKWSIARTIIIYGITDNMSRSNLVLWAKGEIERGNKINVVNDQFRSPTLAEDLADGCIAIMDKKANGLYHLSGPKTYSIIEMVNLVADYYDLDRSLINPVSSASLNQPAKRPLKTGFDISKARNDLDYDPVDFLTGIKIMDRQIKQQHEY